MSRSFRYTLQIFLPILLFTACSRSSGPSPPSTRIPVKDDLGRIVLLVRGPQRIISLSPSLTEMLYLLGLGDRIVGVTTYCDFPPEARSKEKIGDTVNPNLEKIVGLQADLILVSSASQLEHFDAQLRRMGLPVYAVRADSLESVVGAIERLGELTGSQKVARERAAALREVIRSIQSRTRDLPRVRVFLVIQRQPLMVAGERSFLTDVIRRAGGESITTDAAREYAQYSVEGIIAKAPEVIILPSREERPRRITDLVWPELQTTPAMRDRRVYSLNNDLLLRPGPRLVEGLKDLAMVLHPEAFANGPRAQGIP